MYEDEHLYINSLPTHMHNLSVIHAKFITSHTIKYKFHFKHIYYENNILTNKENNKMDKINTFEKACKTEFPIELVPLKLSCAKLIRICFVIEWKVYTE